MAKKPRPKKSRPAGSLARPKGKGEHGEPGKVKRYEAEFYFVNDCVLEGEVDIPKGEMRLSIKGGATPYVIKGKQWTTIGKVRDTRYEGINCFPGGSPVTATWTLAGGKYTGTWIEGPDEFTFWFQLGREKDVS